MGGRVLINLTTDINKINSILKHPDIWPLISDPSDDIEKFIPPMDDNHYLYESGVLFILHPEGDDLEIHANVLPESRGKAKAAAQEALNYGFNVLKTDRIIANIPEKYGNVYGFARKFMNDDGIVNGEHRLSLRVEEWAL